MCRVSVDIGGIAIPPIPKPTPPLFHVGGTGNGSGITRALIDTSPDMREQLIDAGVGALDGVIYTHSHADHVHGVDDLRMVVFNMRERVNVWADQATCDALLDRFGYVFIQPEGSSYPPILNLNLLDGPVTITGAGGDITFTPFEVEHGRIDALGFRIKIWCTCQMSLQ